MRIKIFADVATVGRLYKAGEVADVQEPLALALIRGGKAEPLDKSALPALVEPEKEVAPEPAEEPIPEAPKPELPAEPPKKKASKKKASKK